MPREGFSLFGEECFLRTDMYHQYAPFFSEFQYKLTHGGSLLYSWDIGMGVNFSALYAYYLASPMNWLVVLCPKQFLIEFMTVLIVIKTGLSGLSFTWYLRKAYGEQRFRFLLFWDFLCVKRLYGSLQLEYYVAGLHPFTARSFFSDLERLVKEKKGMVVLYCPGSFPFCQTIIFPS